MSQKMLRSFYSKLRPLTGFEFFCIEHRIDEISAKAKSSARDRKELKMLIAVLERSLWVLHHSSGAA
jgi:hypothetical protein